MVNYTVNDVTNDRHSDAHLGQRTIRGVGWTLMSQMGKQSVQFLVSVIMARLLGPQAFGLIGMIYVFTGFMSLFGEMGFGAALVQHQQIENRHLSSVFWLNVALGAILTGGLIVGAPWIGAFYSQAVLIPLTQVLACNFLIVPLGLVPTSILSRALNFKHIAFAEMLGVFAGGVTAIAMAALGYGVWSLVCQILLTSFITVLGLWMFAKWRPALRFDRHAVKELLSYSLNLLGFNVFNYWVRNGDNLLVGKYFGTAQLGVYARAYSFMLLPLSQITGILSRVMFPALSLIQTDRPRVKQIYLRSVAIIALVTFPIMLGLFVVADRFVFALLGNEWAGVIPILRIFCLLGMVQSIGSTVGWIYQSQGRTDWMFRWGIGAGTLLIFSIVLGVFLGSIESVAVCYSCASGLLLLYPSFAIPGKLINMSVAEVVRSVSGIFACAVSMAFGVFIVGMLLPFGWSEWICLIIEAVVGIGIYWLMVSRSQLPAYVELVTLIRTYVSMWRQARVSKQLSG